MYLNSKLNLGASRFVGRKSFRDGMTFDDGRRVIDTGGNQQGVRFDHPLKMHDGRVCDSTGAFLVGELERLDLTLHKPLAAVTWGRDIQLREDVTIADEASSFTNSTFGSTGGLGTGNSIGTGKAWIGKNTTEITGISVDISKTPQPLRLWGTELKYTIPELESAAKLGRPVDSQLFEGMQLKHQMDIDEQVYYGDGPFGDKGLTNHGGITPVAVANGAGGDSEWATKSPDEILADVNSALSLVWSNSAWAVLPQEIRLPPAQFGYISTAKVSNAGNISILKYVLENNIVATASGLKLNIQPLKWLIGAGVSGTIGVAGTVDRMLVYTNEKERVRYPMTLLQRTAIQYDSIYHKTTYYCRLGVIEMVYPETVGYFDGI